MTTFLVHKNQFYKTYKLKKNDKKIKFGTILSKKMTVSTKMKRSLNNRFVHHACLYKNIFLQRDL